MGITVHHDDLPSDDLVDLFIEDMGDIEAEELDAGQAFGSWGSFGTFGSAFGCASSVSTGSCVS